MDHQAYELRPSISRKCVDCGSPYVRNNALRCFDCAARQQRNRRKSKPSEHRQRLLEHLMK